MEVARDQLILLQNGQKFCYGKRERLLSVQNSAYTVIQKDTCFNAGQRGVFSVSLLIMVG